MTGFLVDDRFQEIAQFLTELYPLNPGADGFYVNAALRTGLSDELLALGYIMDPFAQGLSAGDPYFQSPGFSAAGDVFALDKLIAEGAISTDEAEAFLSQKYPSQAWSGGSWADFAGQAADEAVIESEAAAAPGDPDAPTPTDIAASVQQAPGNANQGAAAQGLPISVPSIDDLPDEYDPDAIMQVLEDLTTQAFLNDQALNSGAVRFPSGSVDGGVIAPGTLPPTAMKPIAWSKLLSQLPGPADAIELDTATSENLDRWVSSGPARVRTVKAVRFPAEWKPYRGVHRYRILDSGTPFGVMGMLLDTSRWPPASGATPPDVRPIWGFVAHRIPHYLGRPPVGILGLGFVGDAPVPFGYEHRDGGTPSAFAGTPRLFDDKAKAGFQDVTRTWATALGADAALDPTATDLANMAGIVVSLITGRTAEEVYEQLNTRVPLAGAGIRSSGHGPSATLPEGLAIQAPAPSSVVRYNGTSFDHLAEGAALASETRLVQGVPFSYEDCAKMVPSNTHFSLVVTASSDAIHESPGSSWGSPQVWGEHGFRLASGDDRVVQVDALIF